MKWWAMFGGFLLHVVVGTIGFGGLLLSQASGGEGGGILVVFGAPVAGLAYGLVGVPSGYYMVKKEYLVAAAISVLTAFGMGMAILEMLS